MKGKVDKDLVLFKSKLNDLLDQPSPYKTYLTKIVPMLENLTGYYREADGQTKRKILGCIFQKNSFLKKSSFAKASEDNRRVATTQDECECECEF